MKFEIKENGAVSIEFAVVAVLLLTLIFGAIDFSLLIFNKQVITNAAREGARRGVVLSVPRISESEVIGTVLSYCQDNLITGGDPGTALGTPVVSYESKEGTIVSGPDDAKQGGIIRVEVEYTYDYLVISYLGIGPTVLKAEVKMTME